jgi:hypothetical protein
LDNLFFVFLFEDATPLPEPETPPVMPVEDNYDGDEEEMLYEDDASVLDDPVTTSPCPRILKQKGCRVSARGYP